ncbi:TonB-dependent receptor family protein [Mucilaginibacter sp. 21P]|uniref:outer membrane beta-barrel family protein n=1 Tax=Mucilaginibacter sp. 21P TaxID=2778902 RepID=UPI001C598683|nr:outer membrane beta-barrel family protein [Mucilaginibacter sp. 21P]QXV63827.1 TonB-dependent receptor family protein [Mucilaginibacter sp. 21P]
MKTNLLFLLILLLPGFLKAQTKIPGKVVDASGHPLDAVTVTLLKDQKQVASAFADLGTFSLIYKEPGSYSVKASLVGYQPTSLTLLLPKDSIVITMQPDSKQLSEVTVAYRRPVIERQIDRVSFNVENSLLATGGSAWEALVKAPGVQVNASNEVTANRKTVKIYMDGKPLQLSGEDLASYLQGLPSDQVARVEIYSNPPARFDAEGASVINIVTKKGKKEGFNLALNSGLLQGIYPGYNAGTTFNYRKSKFNVYGNYSFTHRHSFQDHNTAIDFGNSLWSSVNRNIYQSDNHNYRLGADYQISPNQVLGVLITGNNRNGTTEGNTFTKATNKQQVLDSTLRTVNLVPGSGSQYTYNLNYNLKLDSGKSSLNIDADYSPYRTTSNAYADNQSFLPDGSLTDNRFHIFTPSQQKIDIYSGKVDYAFKAGKSWDITTGAKYSSTKSRNNFIYYDRAGDALTLIPQNGNQFIYRENNAALYASLSGTIGNWTLQGGLRAEYTRAKGYSVTLNTTNERHYLKLFPTLFAQYKLNDDQQLQLNYAYRIERPEYNRLNPARRYLSPYNIYVGNPGLQPAFVHNLELSYTYKDYHVTAYYTSTHDVFTNINMQDNQTRIYYGTHANLGLSAIAGVRLSAAVRPSGWWEINAIADGYRQHEASAYLNSSFDYHLISFAGNLDQAFTINAKQGIKAELNAGWYGPGIQGIYRNRANGQVDAGVKTNMLHGKGSLRLAVNDIFNTNTNYVSINYQDQQSRFFHHVESRTVALSFSYRLGKNITASRNRSTASEEERKRAQ